MRAKLCRWLWSHGWKRLAWALYPELAVRIALAELEEKKKRRFWEDD